MSYLRDTKIVKDLSEKLNCGIISENLCHDILNEVE